MARRKEYRRGGGGRGRKKGSVWQQDREAVSAVAAGRVFALERVLHAAAVTSGGERSWSSAAVNRSMTFIGPPHLGQR
jgi:hypothetical protein